MDSKLYPAFIDDAMRRLPEIRSALLVFLQGGGPAAVLELPSAHLRSILGSADMLGLTEAADLTRDLIRDISSISQAPESNRNGVAPLDLLAKLEATLLKKNIDDESFSLDIDDFVDGSFKLLQVEREPAGELVPLDDLQSGEIAEPFADAAIQQDEELEGFEIDDELLEVFAEEAEELLSNMEASLEALANDPNDRNSLWEIRRNAHTFKGSAGIVGFKPLSELAHRIEDLLDKLAEIEGSSNPRIFELLRTSTDCLKALTSGENTSAVFQRISQLYYDFDGVLAAMHETPALEIPGEALAFDVNDPVATRSAEVITVPTPAAFIPELSAETALAGVTDEKSQPRHGSARSIVRVSLERLDELVHIVRDMIISRSVFEERLKELERQIEELHTTTRRLQSTSSKLEVDFEASMLISGTEPAFGGQAYGELPPASRQQGFDDLEYDRYTEFHQSTRELAETASDTFAINTALDVLKGNFETLFDDQSRLVEDLQEKLMRIRMVEFDSLGTRLQRAVRVTCEEEQKKAEVVISNQRLEVDTQILDSLIEPLTHLLKNAVVHGIEPPDIRRLVGKPETGLIEVAAAKEETHIVLTVSDDGRGIVPTAIREKAVSLGMIDSDAADELSDEDALELIFLPGLSTAEKINLSAGRGVGMSIVKESIQTQRGTISIESVPQKGTKFTIRMPLALAVTNALLVRSGRQTYALPLKQIRHIAELTGSNQVKKGKRDEFEYAGAKLPLVQLNERLRPGDPRNLPSDSLRGAYAVLVQTVGRTYALSVEEIVRSEEIVIKPLGRPLDNLQGLLGAAILGSGELVPVLDLPVLLKQKVKNKKNAEFQPEKEEVSIMIVDDSPSVRHLTSKVIAGAGWKVLTAKDGLDALEQLKTAASLPKVILSDIEMPRMDGYEFAAALKRSDQFNGIPVVMITSRSADKHREKALECGVSQYLTKPYDDAELIDTIKVLANIT